MPGNPIFREPGLFMPDSGTRYSGLGGSGSMYAAPSRGSITTYYVDPVNGLDANNGLGPDASHATNKPWQTLFKLLGSSGLTSGGIAYLAPGVYRENNITCNMTNPTAPTDIIGDPANAQGFKTAAGARVASGQVQWTAYSPNDKSATTLNQLLGINGRSFLTFANIYFIGGRNAMIVNADSPGGNLTFRNCSFTSQQLRCIRIGLTPLTPNILIDACRFYTFNAGTGVEFQFNRTAGLDYDANCTVQRCLFQAQGSPVIAIASTGSGAGLGGGVRILDCTVLAGGDAIYVQDANVSLSYPTRVTRCFISAEANALRATTTGQLYEEFNLITAGTPRANVPVGKGSNSDFSYAPLLHFGQEQAWGAQVRLQGTPMAASPLIGFAGGGLGNDLLDNPRPSGATGNALGAVGALERYNNWGQETTTVRTGANALSVTGPGVQDFDIPVDAAATTVSVYLRHDANYTGPDPELRIVRGEEAGVPDIIAPVTSGAPDVWEQVSATFTPTSAGIVTLRLVSQDRAGTGKAFADDFAVT
jgi:hypothetical protein